MNTAFRMDTFAWFILLRALPGLGCIALSNCQQTLAAGMLLVLAVWTDVTLAWVARKRDWEKGATHIQVEGFVDFVCFIWAPVAFVLAQDGCRFALYATPLFILAGCFRLARFNVEGLLARRYRGLPVTYNGYFFPFAALGLNYFPAINSGAVYALLFSLIAVMMASGRFTTPEV